MAISYAHSAEERRIIDQLEEGRAKEARAQQEEEQEIARKIEEYRRNIDKKVPQKAGIIQKLLLYSVTGFFDVVLDLVFGLSAAVISITGVGLIIAGALEIFGDIIDIGVAGMLIVWVTAFYAPKIVRALTSEQGEEKRYVASVLTFLYFKQLIIITAGTGIELVPVLEIIPTWMGTVRYCIKLQDNASDKIRAYYQKRLEKLVEEAQKNI